MGSTGHAEVRVVPAREVVVEQDCSMRMDLLDSLEDTAIY